VRGGTAWVSLEPCAHHGRTPPCCDALIAAGISRVVVATADPFPGVAGRGIARLRSAGVQVVLAEPGPIIDAARELNMGFFSRVIRRRPWVRMKVAASLDGRTALPNGQSQWITGPEARRDGHAWRRRAGAILTGVGTVRDDDPMLDVRLVETHRQPLRVVVDSSFGTPLSARLLQDAQRTLIVGAVEDSSQAEALREKGASVRVLPGQDGRVDLPQLLHELANHGVNELHVEAGATLNGALWSAGLVDEVLVYLAPMLLGPGRGMVDLPALTSLNDHAALAVIDCRQVGPDLAVRLRLRGAEPLAI
jgi:diaminohydroxyphosphoribosylaminopyrimidine deaminase/5-amino-6-(5-phosphoribosylamino)uracil reductase